MRYFLLGFDPAQIRDFAALAAVEVTQNDGDFLFRLVALERRQRLSYPDLVAWVASALKIPDFNSNVTEPPALVIDATGIGIAVRDLLIKSGIQPVAVTTTSGNRVTEEDNSNFHVGKALLVGKFLTAFDSGRFQLNPNHPVYQQFERELLAFKAEISARGNAIFEAGDNEHDDLISACCLVTWWAEARPKPMPIVMFLPPTPNQLRTPPWRISSYSFGKSRY